MPEVSEWWYSPDIVTLSVVWIIPRWTSRKRQRKGEEWLMWSWTERADRRRCLVEPTPKRRRAADSADHIKVSYVTYMDLAGVCVYACVHAWASICVCVLFPGVGGWGAMSQTWRVHGGEPDVDWWRLCESAHMHKPCICDTVSEVSEKGKIRLPFQFGEGETEKQEWGGGKTPQLVFSTGGFLATLLSRYRSQTTSLGDYVYGLRQQEWGCSLLFCWVPPVLYDRGQFRSPHAGTMVPKSNKRRLK